MAKVRIEEILDQFSHDLTRALDDALVRTDPENEKEKKCAQLSSESRPNRVSAEGEQK